MIVPSKRVYVFILILDVSIIYIYIYKYTERERERQTLLIYPSESKAFFRSAKDIF